MASLKRNFESVVEPPPIVNKSKKLKQYWIDKQQELPPPHDRSSLPADVVNLYAASTKPFADVASKRSHPPPPPPFADVASHQQDHRIKLQHNDPVEAEKLKTYHKNKRDKHKEQIELYKGVDIRESESLLKSYETRLNNITLRDNQYNRLTNEKKQEFENERDQYFEKGEEIKKIKDPVKLAEKMKDKRELVLKLKNEYLALKAEHDTFHERVAEETKALFEKIDQLRRILSIPHELELDEMYDKMQKRIENTVLHGDIKSLSYRDLLSYLQYDKNPTVNRQPTLAKIFEYIRSQNLQTPDSDGETNHLTAIMRGYRNKGLSTGYGTNTVRKGGKSRRQKSRKSRLFRRSRKARR
jgi:hypothetical protein